MGSAAPAGHSVSNHTCGRVSSSARGMSRFAGRTRSATNRERIAAVGSDRPYCRTVRSRSAGPCVRPAVLVHTKGFGSSFHGAIQALTSSSRALTLRWDERRSLRLVNSANQRSTRLSQLPEVGVKCTRGGGEMQMKPWVAGESFLDRWSCALRSCHTPGASPTRLGCWRRWF